MTFYAEIKADTCDADYVNSFVKLDEDGYFLVKKVAAVIKQKSDEKGYSFHSWDTGNDYYDDPEEDLSIIIDEYEGLLTLDEIVAFNLLLGSPMQNYYVHSVVSIILHEVVDTTELL